MFTVNSHLYPNLLFLYKHHSISVKTNATLWTLTCSRREARKWIMLDVWRGIKWLCWAITTVHYAWENLYYDIVIGDFWWIERWENRRRKQPLAWTHSLLLSWERTHICHVYMCQKCKLPFKNVYLNILLKL